MEKDLDVKSPPLYHASSLDSEDERGAIAVDTKWTGTDDDRKNMVMLGRKQVLRVCMDGYNCPMSGRSNGSTTNDTVSSATFNSFLWSDSPLC